MTRALQTASLVPVEFARGAVPVGCDPAFYSQLLDALTATLANLFAQVPEGRALTNVATCVCEDGKSLMTCGYFDGSYAFIDVAAGIEGVTYDRTNALTHPETIDHALRWLATKRTAALN